MWNQFRQLSEGVPFRVLLALGLLFAILSSVLSDLRSGAASGWQLVLDLGTIVAFLLLVLSLWPPAEEFLARLWDEYYPSVLGLLAMFFLSWGGYLVTTSSADPSQRYLTLALGLVFAVAFAGWLRERRESAQSP